MVEVQVKWGDSVDELDQLNVSPGNKMHTGKRGDAVLRGEADYLLFG